MLWDAFDPKTAGPDVVLSNNNLSIDSTSGTVDTGAITTQYLNTGKYYFEITLVNAGTGPKGCGIAVPGTPYSQLISGTNGLIVIGNGTVFLNGTSILSIGAMVVGSPIYLAINLDFMLAWLKSAPGNNWNGNASYSPGSPGIGGVDISAVFSAKQTTPAVMINNDLGQQFTANFGQSAFSGTVPSGFTPGWPILIPTKPQIYRWRRGQYPNL